VGGFEVVLGTSWRGGLSGLLESGKMSGSGGSLRRGGSHDQDGGISC
jgi:hypothetical protein